MQNRLDVPYPIWSKILLTLRQIFAIAEADFSKLKHDPSELITRMVQPAIWLLIFGESLARARIVQTHDSSYLDYIAPGILAQSVLFIAIFFGIALIWERDMGILHKILVTPAPRPCLIIGRALAASIRGLSQVVIVYLLCFFLGVDLRFDPLALLGVLVMVMLAGAIFSTLSLIAASIVKKRERFMGIGQLITMPLFFASNSLYPIEIMPTWIKFISIVNPLTYQVDALRHLMILHEPTQFSLPFDYGISILVFIAFVAIATPLYPKILT